MLLLTHDIFCINKVIGIQFSVSMIAIYTDKHTYIQITLLKLSIYIINHFISARYNNGYLHESFFPKFTFKMFKIHRSFLRG